MKKESINEFQDYSCDNEEIQSYINNRVMQQIDWYDKKSNKYKKTYYFFSVFILILNTSTIFISSINDNGQRNIWLIVISCCSAFLVGLNNLIAPKDLWIKYRTYCERLKSVLHRYFVHASEFSNIKINQANDLLVTIIENGIATENQTWVKSANIVTIDQTQDPE